MSALLVLMAVAAPFAIYVWIVQQREGGVAADRPGYVRRALQPLAFCALVVAAIVVRRRLYADLFGHGSSRPGHAAPAAHLPRAHAAHAAATPQAHFEWPVLVVVVALAVAALALAALRRRRAEPDAAEGAIDEELAATIGDAIDDLEAEPDARRAVVAAYARMERVLARHGLRRRPSQTPLEYLRAVLSALSGRGAAARRLTELFEEAQFSTHRVDEAMKRDAIASLRSIRDGLLETPA
jgi:MYXO-CTERM domain-containing protein